MEPPNRSSIWRFPEFASYNPPSNYNDNELFCGGYSVQYEQNKGRCGICGDPWNEPEPRDNEDGGKFGRGIIVANYKSGQIFPFSVELTRSHLGRFRLRLCARNNPSERVTQGCFDKNKLMLMDDRGKKLGIRYPVQERTGFYNGSAFLPENVKCSHCVIQWQYKAGNTWGHCKNGTFKTGCGHQETFRGCSDVSIS
ncbi:unnamed protein product [Allacma fusca]|uniref:Chitin-binding type-4 domain-containing protein n=1 Tax=Allacma fusca TaxID=39272 RepID=A0A8J2P9G2_9HEXA|nr:unnamed protein product [Allacma fusca]